MPDPVRPPVAPVAAILWTASASVTQVMLVPALLTRGRAAQVTPLDAPQSSRTKEPPTHCAKELPTQAFCPAVHELLAVSVANSAFSFWAACPFASAKEEVEVEEVAAEVVAVAAAAVVATAVVASTLEHAASAVEDESLEAAVVDSVVLLEELEPEPEDVPMVAMFLKKMSS